MKQAIVVIVIVVGLIGSATWFGISRSSAPSIPAAEVSQRLLLAEKFVESRDGARALEVFTELETVGYKPDERAQVIRIEALELAGRTSEASAAADAFLKQFPDSPRRTQAELVRLTAELASAGLSNPTLRTSVEDFLSRNPNHPGATRLHIALAQQDTTIGDHEAAKRRLETVMRQSKDDAAILAIARPLGEANLEKLFSSTLFEGDQTYTVVRNDAIFNIASKHGITPELLMRCNNISDPRALRIGQKLKIPSVRFSLHVDVSANTMLLKNHGEFFKLYSVRTGRVAGSTPTGEFRILNKKTNPTWRPGNGFAYLPGDPNNELGTRWMAFQGDILGIHGTLHPETVGEYASNGCVGMTKEDVEELFDLVTVGTPLIIEGQQDLERHRVIPAPNVPPPQQEVARR